jgi:hypothetical protein
MRDLSNTTIIIPLNLESDDRIRNAYIVISYLLHNFNTSIIIKEVDDYSKFTENVIPLLKKNLNESQLNNLTHVFEKKSNQIFHKSKYINDMLSLVKTEVVCNYDIDVILPLESYVKSENMCKNGYDLVYPFTHGNAQYRLHIPNLEGYLKLENQLPKFEDLISISSHYDLWVSTFGHTQFFNTKSFIKYYMMNENFSSYSPEDLEISIRFNKLSCNVGRVEGTIIHIEHTRFLNSMDNSIATPKNNLVLNQIKNFTKEQLIEYYNSQEYYKQRISNYDSIK